MRERMLGKTVTVHLESGIPGAPGFPVPVGSAVDLNGCRHAVYVLGFGAALPPELSGMVVAVIRHTNQLDASWVVTPPGLRLHQGQIMEQLAPQERFAHGRIHTLYEQSCGTIPFRMTPEGIEYLLLLQRGSHTWSFPKGHMEPFETEAQTAARELWEETRQACRPLEGFRETLSYSLGHRRSKTIVLFLGEIAGHPRPQRTEILEAHFLPRQTVIQLLHHKPYRAILEHAEQAILAQRSAGLQKEVLHP